MHVLYTEVVKNSVKVDFVQQTPKYMHLAIPGIAFSSQSFLTATHSTPFEGCQSHHSTML